MDVLSNINILWGHILIDELARAGVREIVISPGSRSTPLTLAAAEHPDIRDINVLDERSAGFFALGLAMASGQPTALICTSGTAAANYLPAVIEAFHSRIPLVVLTADRPEWLRDCGAPQAMNQTRLFGEHVAYFHELAQPEADRAKLRYLRSTVSKAVALTLDGPVHLNVPFRKPLEPTFVDRNAPDGVRALTLETPEVAGLPNRLPWVQASTSRHADQAEILTLKRALTRAKKPVIVAGAMIDALKLKPAIEAFSKHLDIPILAEAASQLRGDIAIPADLLLTNSAIKESLQPDLILVFGRSPINWPVQRWLAKQDAEVIYFGAPDYHGLENPEHQPCTWLRSDASGIIRAALTFPPATTQNSKNLRSLHTELAKILAEPSETGPLFDGAVHRALNIFPEDLAIFISSSMPFRDYETFSSAKNPLFFNRGLNGIDGVLSTAFGVAAARSPAGNEPGVAVVIGDVAFAHDMGALLTAARAGVSAIVIVINNGGGRIFDFLPVNGSPGFEKHFQTPPGLDIGALTAATGAVYHRVTTEAEVRELLPGLTEKSGIQVVEVVTDWETSKSTRRALLKTVEDHPVQLTHKSARIVPNNTSPQKKNSIVLLHGFTGTPADWDRLIAELPDYDCHALPLPGHGLRAPESWEDGLQILLEELDLRALQNPHLVAYSMGGRLAVGLASIAPERFKSLITIGAHSGMHHAKDRTARAELDRARAQEVEKDLHGFLRDWSRHPILNLTGRESAQKQVGRAGHHGAGLAKALHNLSPGLQPVYSEPLRIPACFVAGELDEHYVKLAHQMADELEGCARVVPESGHAVHNDAPEALARLIIEFLETP